MSDPAQLLVDHLDIWTGATLRKSGSGRGNGGKISLYGIDKLRSLILDLAVRGKLVPQDPAEGDAGELLRSYRTSKQKLLKEKRIRNQKVTAYIPAEEVPYKLPDGWVWARLGEIGFVCNGNSISAEDKKQRYSQVADYPFIATKDVGYGFEPLDYEGGVWIPAEEPKFAVANAGTTLICSEGGSAGKKCGLTVRDVCFGNKLFAVNHFGEFEPKFLLAWYQTTTFYELFSQQMTGIIGGISLARFIELPCPVPSIGEQKRIVAKVDELMALVDALEAGTRAGMAAHETLVRELLATLVNSQDLGDLARNWSRIEAHFDTLFTTEESIDALKQTVLELAVRGKLVRQKDTEASARHLESEIKRWRDSAIKQKIVRPNRKPQQPITECEHPFPKPPGWAFLRLGDLIYIKSGDGLTSSQMRDGDVPVYGGNGITGYHDAPNSWEPTVVIGRVGYYCGSVHLTPERAWITDNAFRTIFDNKNVDIDFLVILLNGTNLKENENATAQPVISGAKIYPLVVGLPPLQEQRDIVRKYRALMQLCDRAIDGIRRCVQVEAQIADFAAMFLV